MLFRSWLVAFAFLLANNYLLFLFIGPAYPRVVAASTLIENAWGLEPIRRYVLEGLGMLFTVLLIQVAAVLVNPRRDATPWLVRAIGMIWSRTVSTRSGVQDGR